MYNFIMMYLSDLLVFCVFVCICVIFLEYVYDASKGGKFFRNIYWTELYWTIEDGTMWFTCGFSWLGLEQMLKKGGVILPSWTCFYFNFTDILVTYLLIYLQFQFLETCIIAVLMRWKSKIFCSRFFLSSPVCESELVGKTKIKYEA